MPQGKFLMTKQLIPYGIYLCVGGLGLFTAVDREEFLFKSVFAAKELKRTVHAFETLKFTLLIVFELGQNW